MGTGVGGVAGRGKLGVQLILSARRTRPKEAALRRSGEADTLQASCRDLRKQRNRQRKV